MSKQGFFGGLISGVSIQDKINFARHLSIVVKAGLPILEGLKMIQKQTESKALVRVIEQIIRDVSDGQFLATSMERAPHVFDGFFVNIVRVGETSGTLAANLLYLAEELKKSHDLKSKIRSAMIYPVIIMIATITLISFLVFFAFPKILPLFASLHVELPLPTRILIAVSSFLLASGLWVLGGVAIALIGLRVLFLIPPIRLLFHKLLLILPIFGSLSVQINVANFTRILAVLLRGGIKIVEAVTITAATFDNLVYRQTLLYSAEQIKKGEQLASYLAAHRHTFPVLLSGLIEIGENTGNLEDNLIYLADYYREEAEHSIQNLTSLIEPLLLLTMGLVVGFVAISIITPIYKITQGVGG
ncbi:MAG: type II secretion system F family protein [bacterium]|nr:type II secretion system F family protein [bacterium]